MKAELLRKQEEVNKAKQHAINPTINYIPKHDRDSSSNRLLAASRRSFVKKTTNDHKLPETEDTEKSVNKQQDEELLIKSRRILEAKTKLYERMSASGGSLNSEDTCLVMFNEKKQMTRSDSKNVYQSTELSDASDDDLTSSDDDPDNEWTEYTDCLGRTRKCLKTDVDLFKKRDNDLAKVVAERQTTNDTGGDLIGPPAPASNISQPWFVDTTGANTSKGKDTPGNTVDDDYSMLSTTTKLEEMRKQWEEKEWENMNRDQIHYQDVLFDEARTHGVGYYAFSADQKERAKQQQMLEDERQRTLEAQKQREEQREHRDRIIAQRVLAAKNRQRARLGLPPLTMEDEEKAKAEEPNQDLYDDKADRKKKKKEEIERRMKEKEEFEREQQRQQHVRPWDKPKIVTHQVHQKHASDEEEEKWEYKPERRQPMSQEEWNEMKRAERFTEFAPVPESEYKDPRESFNRFTTIKKKPLDEFTPVPEPEYDDTKESFNRFTTIKKKPFKRRNVECSEAKSENSMNIPIRNELSDNDDDEANKRKRSEIPPPPTFEYYGPSAAKTQKCPRNSSNELETSIAAGLRFLRDQSDKTGTGTKQTWSAKADY